MNSKKPLAKNTRSVRRRAANRGKRARSPTPPPGSKSYHHGDLQAALLKVTEELVEKNGVAAFTLRECARRAGVSHSAPAHYFQNKDALLTELAIKAARERYDLTEQRLAEAGPDPIDRLISLGVCYVDYAVRHPRLHDLIFHAGVDGHDKPQLNSIKDALASTFVGCVEEVLGKRLPPLESAVPETVLPWAIVHGFAALVNNDLLLHDVPSRRRSDAAVELSEKVLRMLRPFFVLMRDNPPSD